MKRASATLALLFVAGMRTAYADDEHAFVELVAPRDSYFVHEVIRLRVRFGVDADFLRANVVQMFQRNLDVPVQVQAPWIRNLPGTTALDDEPPAPGDGAGRRSFALEDGVAAATPIADLVRDGRKYAAWEIERSYLPERAGGLSISGPILRFAYSTRFEDDFIQGRVPADRRDASVRGAAMSLVIRALPEEGRPPEFTGAVGRFTVAAEIDRHEVVVGESVKLTLRVEGGGDLEHFDAPRLVGLARYHVYGVIDDKSRTRRKVTYDIAPLDENVTEAPSIPFAFFDPAPPAGYRIARTAPIPIRVRARAASGSKTPVADDRVVAPRGALPFVVAVAVVAASLVALAFLLRRRARQGARDDSDRPRVREAAAAFRTGVARPNADVAGQLASFLSECLRCPPPAVITPDLAARLAAAGISTALAVRAATLIEGLVATRYGAGPTAVDGRGDARALVDELEAAFEKERVPS